jgi:hypothetical protein
MTPPEDKTPYDRFLETRADYIARERVASEQAEKVLIAGAAGVLALSVTFLEKIAPTPKPETLALLAIGWLLLLLSLAASLVTFVLRSQNYRSAREALDLTAGTGKPDFRNVDSMNKWLDGLLHVRLWTLVAGVVLLVVFAYTNIPRVS